MTDVRIFTSRVFSTSNAILAATFFALFGVLFTYTQYLQLVRGYGPLVAGVGAVPFAIVMATVASSSDRMVGRFGVRSSIATGLAVMSAGLLVLSIAADRYAPFGILAAIMALVGAGMGLVMAPATTTSMSSVAPQQASMASSINSVVRELGGVLGVAVIGTVVATVFRSRFEPGVGTSTADPAQIHAGAPRECLDRRSEPGLHLGDEYRNPNLCRSRVRRCVGRHCTVSRTTSPGFLSSRRPRQLG
ncbi:MFS transporter [Rhodococcus sp. 3Y1]